MNNLDKKLKIGFIGANFTTKHLHNELVKSQRVIVWSHSKPDEPFSEKIDFCYVSMPWERLRNYLRKRGSQRSLPYYYKQLIPSLWSKQPDIIVVLDFYKLWFIQALLYKIFHPSVKLIIHSETKRTPPSVSARLFFWMMVGLVRLFRKYIHHIFTYSDTGMTYMQKILPRIPVSHLILPIDENTPLYTAPAPGTAIRILMPARFVSLKRHEDVIKAAESIISNQNIHIDFASFSHDLAPQKKYIEDLLEQSSAKNVISIIKAIEAPFDNYYTLLKEYDAVILPSENEGLGAVVPAALHCGKIAIISEAVPANMYMHKSLKKYIIPVGDTNKLAQVFNSLNKSTVFSEGQRAAAFIRDEFQSKRVTQNFISLIQD